MAIVLPEFTVTPGADTTTGGSSSDATSPALPTAGLPSPSIVRPNTSRFPDSEIATLAVDGALYSDWESIWLQYRWLDAFAIFRFIAAEHTPPPADWTLQQFFPGQRCDVTLAQQPALTGLITQRQTSYDAQRHQVQLVGKSWTHWGYKSSVDTPTGNFDGFTLEQVHDAVMGKYGTTKVIGVVNPLPFQKLQNEVGEITWDFLDRLSRVRGAILGADAFGNYLLIGQHTFPVNAMLQEGVNIKACQCEISHDQFFAWIDVRGHGAGSDGSYGAANNEYQCIIKGPAAVYSKIITPSEQTVAGKAEICDRAAVEQRFNYATQIIANIVVYGWTYDGKHLWAPGQNVSINSPMAMLNNITLKLRTVTFEQNNQSGTQTTLECVVPWLLGDTAPFNVGHPELQPPPVTPDATQVPTPPPPPASSEIPT